MRKKLEKDGKWKSKLLGCWWPCRSFGRHRYLCCFQSQGEYRLPVRYRWVLSRLTGTPRWEQERYSKQLRDASAYVSAFTTYFPARDASLRNSRSSFRSNRKGNRSFSEPKTSSRHMGSFSWRTSIFQLVTCITADVHRSSVSMCGNSSLVHSNLRQSKKGSEGFSA